MKTAIILLVYLFFGTPFCQSQDCYPNGIVFVAQSEIDQFFIENINCKRIGGIHIEGDDITDLSSLGNIEVVLSDLKIINCPILTSTDGLQYVDSIFGELKIENLDSLKELSSFENLNYVEGVKISRNPALKNINGFSNIDTIFGPLFINLNYSLETLDAFHGLEYIESKFLFGDSWRLFDLSMFNAVEKIGGEFSISSDSLRSITGFQSLFEIKGLLRFDKITSLTDFSGLGNIEILSGGLSVEESNELITLNGFSSLKILNVGLVISNNTSLSDISIFQNLVEFSGEIRIEDNLSLSSLKGIQYFNPDEINAFSFDLRNNPNISNCSYLSICHIYPQLNEFAIFGNAPGCNTKEEMLAGCIPDTTVLSFQVCPGETMEIADEIFSEPGEYVLDLISCRGLDSLVFVEIQEDTGCDDCDFTLATLGFQILKLDKDNFRLQKLGYNSTTIELHNLDQIIEVLNDIVTKNNSIRLKKRNIPFNKNSIYNFLKTMEVGAVLKL